VSAPTPSTTEPTGASPAGTPASTPATPAAAAPAAQSLTAAEIATIVRSEIATARAQAQQEATAAARAAAAKDEPDPSEKDAKATAKVRAFAEDPDAFMDAELGSRVDKRLEERLSPGLQPMVEQQRDLLLEREQTAIDSKFGTGFFDAKVKPLLFTDEGKGALQVLHPFQQANKERVHLTVQAILGMLMSEDPDELMDQRRKVQEVERKAQEPPFSWGSGAPPPSDPNGKLPQPIREAIARGQEKGSELTEDSYRFASRAGKSLDGWLAETERARAAAKK
jgi:hypothetical protein